MTSVLLRAAVFGNMLLKGKGRTAGTARGTKGENFPLVHFGRFTALHVSPEETEKRLVFRQEANLMEHAFYVTADGDGVLSEAKQNT